jgi:hypothetical protein
MREWYIAVAACGAHMDGLPLNRQLRDRGGYQRIAPTIDSYAFRPSQLEFFVRAVVDDGA